MGKKGGRRGSRDFFLCHRKKKNSARMGCALRARMADRHRLQCTSRGLPVAPCGYLGEGSGVIYGRRDSSGGSANRRCRFRQPRDMTT